jgi:hypothetical protein
MSGQIITSHCNRCGRNTRHDVLAVSPHEEDTTEGNSAEGDALHERYEMLECRGCGDISLRHTKNDEFGPFVVRYPPAIARRKPHWLHDRSSSRVYSPTYVEFDDGFEKIIVSIPEGIIEPMYEVYIALQNDCLRLCAMGVRAALEALMIDKVEDHRNFTKNLDELEKAHYISHRNRTSLEAILEVGHAATHRGWDPSSNDINTILDIMENLIQSVYLHEVHAEDLKKAVPKKPPKPNKPSEM